MANVSPMRKEAEVQSDDAGIEAKPVFPGVNASISYQIAQNAGVHLSTMFLRDDPAPEQEKCLGKILNVTAVIGLTEKLIENRKELENAKKRLADLSEDTESKKTIKEQIAELQAENAEHARLEEQKYRESGRHGTFKMEGAAKRKAEGFVQDIERKKTELKKLDSDLEVQRQKFRDSIRNFGVAVETIETEIRLRREAYGE